MVDSEKSWFHFLSFVFLCLFWFIFCLYSLVFGICRETPAMKWQDFYLFLYISAWMPRRVLNFSHVCLSRAQPCTESTFAHTHSGWCCKLSIQTHMKRLKIHKIKPGLGTKTIKLNWSFETWIQTRLYWWKSCVVQFSTLMSFCTSAL